MGMEPRVRRFKSVSEIENGVLEDNRGRSQTGRTARYLEGCPAVRRAQEGPLDPPHVDRDRVVPDEDRRPARQSELPTTRGY